MKSGNCTLIKGIAVLTLILSALMFGGCVDNPVDTNKSTTVENAAANTEYVDLSELYNSVKEKQKKLQERQEQQGWGNAAGEQNIDSVYDDMKRLSDELAAAKIR